MPIRRSKLPAPLPEGFIMTDTSKKSWRLGRKLGQGGFGLIYLASPDCDVTVPNEAAYAIKVENFQNGPLFCELKFYQRAVKKDDVKKWIHSHNLDYLGIPGYWGTGEANYNSRYRFMVVDRLGEDLLKLQNKNGGRLPVKTVMQIGIRMLDILEYTHEHEYVHGDIKAGNILLHTSDPNKVYLADYGLSYRYCPNGKHKEYKEDPRKCHNGTIEFTSRDAHRGVARSRRGDLEILAYCMLHWISGSLPWEKDTDYATILASKAKLWDGLPHSVTEWSGQENGCQALAKFMAEVSVLAYTEKPNYAALRRILLNALDSLGTSLASPLIISDTRSFQKSSPGIRKKSAIRKRVEKETEENGVQIKNNNPLNPCPSRKTPKNYLKKTAAVRLYTNNDDDRRGYYPCFGTSNVEDVPSNSERPTVPYLYLDEPSIYKPRRRMQTVRASQDSGEDPRYGDANHEHSRETESSSDRQDIYKYGLAVPVLLLMIYYLIYAL